MVSIITCTMRPNNMDNVFLNYNQQLYKDRELIIVLNHDEMSIREWENKASQYKGVRVFQLHSSVTQGECLNYAAKRANYPYIAKFDDDDFYAPNYLIDMMQAASDTNADVLGKRSIFCYLNGSKVLAVRTPQYEHQFTNTVSGATLVIKKSVWEQIKFRRLNYQTDTKFTSQINARGFKIYSTDKYNYVCIRSADLEDHTWKLSDKDFLKKCKIIENTEDWKHLAIK